MNYVLKTHDQAIIIFPEKDLYAGKIYYGKETADKDQ